MLLRFFNVCVACAVLLGLSAPALAQGVPEDAAVPVPVAPVTSSVPARGPALRERAGRRSRSGGTASGVLMLAVLVGAMGYYVVKKLRR